LLDFNFSDAGQKASFFAAAVADGLPAALPVANGLVFCEVPSDLALQRFGQEFPGSKPCEFGDQVPKLRHRYDGKRHSLFCVGDEA
jgi:hypothetical protein